MADEQVTSTSSAGEVIWPLNDHLGTTRDLAEYDAGTDATTVANHRRFDSYGNLISETNATVDLLFGFTGRAYDEASSLPNNWNRWYDAKAGQWMNEDPIGFQAGDSNIRRYVSNLPTMKTDPTGLADNWGNYFYYEWGGFFYSLPGAYIQTAWDGQQAQSLAAGVDGWIPVVDPLESAGAYNREDGVNNASWWVGNITRDIQLFVLMRRSGDLSQWCRNPALYELGSTTIPARVWQTLQNMTVLERGRWIWANHGIGGYFISFRSLEAAGQYGKTICTGGTPGGWLLIGGGTHVWQWLNGQYDGERSERR